VQKGPDMTLLLITLSIWSYTHFSSKDVVKMADFTGNFSLHVDYLPCFILSYFARLSSVWEKWGWNNLLDMPNTRSLHNLNATNTICPIVCTPRRYVQCQQYHTPTVASGCVTDTDDLSTAAVLVMAMHYAV